MDLNRMTEKSREALQQAQTLATRHHQQQVDSEHLLLALLEQEDGAAARILERAGGDLAAIRTRDPGPGAPATGEREWADARASVYHAAPG